MLLLKFLEINLNQNNIDLYNVVEYKTYNMFMLKCINNKLNKILGLLSRRFSALESPRAKIFVQPITYLYRPKPSLFVIVKNRQIICLVF